MLLSTKSIQNGIRLVDNLDGLKKKEWRYTMPYAGFPIREIRNKSMEMVKSLILTNTEKRGIKRSTMDKILREQNLNKKAATLRVMEVFDFPKQFILRNEVLSDPEDYVNIETEKNHCRKKTRIKSGKIKDKTPEKSDYLDLDFMMPTQVREILLEEGLSKDVIDSTLKVDEKRHRKIMQLTLLAEKYKQCPKDCQSKSLPGSNKKHSQTYQSEQSQPTDKGVGCSCCSDVQTRQERRNKRVRPWKDIASPDRMSSTDDSNENTGMKEDTFYLTEAEKAKWSADQEEERVLMGNHFDPPRVVLISSKMPKKHLIPKLVLENERILQIIYDFDTWSFSDVTDAIQKRLDSVKPYCKAKSIVILCQGGAGFLYILRKFVVTPQKMHKESYQDVREFWKRIGSQISKICPGESKLHIVCKNVGEGRQGKEVIRSVQRLVHSDMVRVEVADIQKEQGIKALSLYFNVGRFGLWYDSLDDSDDELDFSIVESSGNDNQDEDNSDSEDIPRTISSLAAEVEDVDT